MVEDTRSNRMHPMLSSLWICVRSRDVVRRFLRLGAARDGALYTTIGQPLKGAKVFSGEISMPSGVTSTSKDYTTGQSRSFDDVSGYHTGFKPTGAIFTKFDRLGYTVMPLPQLKDLRGPLMLEQLYPAPMDGFTEITTPRSRDLLVPDLARSPTNIRARNIEDRFGDQPFHFELIAIPKGMMFAPANPATIGFSLEFDVPLFRVVALFRQDDVDLQRGWLERTRSIRLRVENN